jgi:hypothetical protein
VLWPLRRIVLLRLRRVVELLWSWNRSLPLLENVTASFHGLTPKQVTYVSQCKLFVILPIPFSQPLASFKYHRTRSFRVSPYSPSLK